MIVGVAWKNDADAAARQFVARVTARRGATVIDPRRQSGDGLTGRGAAADLLHRA